MSDPSCEKCRSLATYHVGWHRTVSHYFKVFYCYSCGHLTHIPWDHEDKR
jgi:hypothetical protein